MRRRSSTRRGDLGRGPGLPADPCGKGRRVARRAVGKVSNSSRATPYPYADPAGAPVQVAEGGGIMAVIVEARGVVAELSSAPLSLGVAAGESSGCCSRRAHRVRPSFVCSRVSMLQRPAMSASPLAVASWSPTPGRRSRTRSPCSRTSCCSTWQTTRRIATSGRGSRASEPSGRASSSRPRTSTRRAAATGFRWPRGRWWRLTCAVAELLIQMSCRRRRFSRRWRAQRSTSLARELHQLNVAARALLAEMGRSVRDSQDRVAWQTTAGRLAGVSLNDRVLDAAIAHARQS